MIRWAVAALLLVLLLAGGAALLARLAGRRQTRASLLVSVLAHWLGAYVLWTFAAGLGQRWGVLETYDTYVSFVLAVIGAYGHYRVAAARGREPGLVVFVGGQLAWLVIVLVRNGALGR